MDCFSHHSMPTLPIDGEEHRESHEADKDRQNAQENPSGKARSFRKRRLTCAKIELEDDARTAAAALLTYDSEEEENNSDKHPKEMAEVTLNETVEVNVSRSSVKRRRTEDFKSEADNCSKKLSGPTQKKHNSSSIISSAEKRRHSVITTKKKTAKSMTHMHMTEAFICRVRSRLLTKASLSIVAAPGSPSRHSIHRRGSSFEDESACEEKVFKHDHLPFPRDVVGTFSCHGIEPLYDDEDTEDDDKEENEPVSKTKNPEGARSAPTVIAKINQDRGGVAYPYANDWHTALFAAYDGHGEGGELVSQFAMTEIQKRLEKHSDFDTNIEKAFFETFVKVDEDLEDEVDIEPLYSGTTACVVLIRGNILHIANVGDSRAVLARRTKTGVRAIDLSIDQNPDSPGEQERIETCGGYVSPPPEAGLSARVWLDPEFTHIGLAMARSIGDHAVKSVGVISEPVVTEHQLTDEDEFMIIATDGVWEFIKSSEAVEIVSRHVFAADGKDAKQGDYSGATAACKDLIETAAKRWNEHEGDYRDDITAVVVKTKELWKNVNGA